jgi:hypothetical protein
MGRYQKDPPGDGWILEKFPFCEQLFKLRNSVLMTEDDNRFTCAHLTVASGKDNLVLPADRSYDGVLGELEVP